ncbi:DUF805 domain-containing protein [Paramagnetospirillum kuznetsovii]|uniref:DUF805 domain-containing protein n=1 Tax=Paramagnetospirillum kuznetsovii TaxID=2053833 RepID=UPI0011BF3893|nr:DUF805 domain-containing protein [Paramagnetospirillum kuznetsovii]
MQMQPKWGSEMHSNISIFSLRGTISQKQAILSIAQYVFIYFVSVNNAVARLLIGAFGASAFYVLIAAYLISHWIMVAATVRRLRAIGRNPWGGILVLVPLLGIIVAFAVALSKDRKLTPTSSAEIIN